MSTQPPRVGLRRRHLRVLLVAGLATLAAGSDYAGCAPRDAPSPPPEGGTLPETTGCLTDRDCVSEDLCVTLACRASECVQIASGPDLDGDGFAGEPCGQDCNDDAPGRFPGAQEFCNGIDEDCDGELDEGAVGLGVASLDHALSRPVVAPLADRLLVMGFEGPDLRLALATPQGRLEGRLPTDIEGVSSIALASRGDSVLLATVIESSVSVREVTLAGGEAVLSAATTIATDTPAVRVRAYHFGGTDWVAWDTEGPAARTLWRSSDGRVFDLAPSVEPIAPSLANDGSRLAVTEGEGTVVFIDPGGDRVGEQLLAGPFATGGALASGEGQVYAAYRDSSDHALVSVTLDGLGAAALAPSGRREDFVTLTSALQAGVMRVIFMRHDTRDASATFYEADLRSILATFGPGQVTSITQLSIDRQELAVMNSGAIVLHSAGPQRSNLATVGCEQ